MLPYVVMLPYIQLPYMLHLSRLTVHFITFYQQIYYRISYIKDKHIQYSEQLNVHNVVKISVFFANNLVIIGKVLNFFLFCTSSRHFRQQLINVVGRKKTIQQQRKTTLGTIDDRSTQV